MRVLFYIIGVLCLLVSSNLKAEYRYRLYLDGKPDSAPIPLSERAQERRLRLGIVTDSLDYAVSDQYLEQIRQEGLRVLSQSRWMNTVVVMAKDGTRINKTLWNRLPFVTRIELLTTTQSASSPKRKAEDKAGLKLSSAAGVTCDLPLLQVNAMTPLYEAGYRGSGMLIAVLDAGFTRINTWDWLSSRVVGSRDMYQPMSGHDQTYTADTHGSCCLSIMASTQDHGVWGTAQEADYYLIRTETDDCESSIEEDMWIAGAELADSLGADVISSSLGYYAFDDGLLDHEPEELGRGVAPISRGAQVACDKGILVVNAAGNFANDPWKYIFFPADVQDVLTVGGVNISGDPAYFTSHGFTSPYVKPDVSALAMGCFTVNANDPEGSATSRGSGTSYAAPLIAGLCASLWGAVPSLSPAQVRQAVRESASQYAHPDSIVGHGIPDFGIALQKARAMADEQQGIETIDADSQETIGTYRVTYDLQGRRVGKTFGCEEEKKGRFLIRQGRVLLPL